MQKTLYLDPAGGITVNLFVGLLLDLGVPEIRLKKELEKLHLGGYRLVLEKKTKRGVTAACFDVELSGPQTPDRDLQGVLELYRRADLDAGVKHRAAAVFWQLALAEAAAQGIAPEAVQFHESGAVDCIIGVTAAALGLAYLEIETVLVAPPAVRSDTADQGGMAVSAPATRRRTDIPTAIATADCKLITPIDAALLSTFAEIVSERPRSLVVDRVGYGAGTYDLAAPNVLTGCLGDLLPDPQWRVAAPYVFGTTP